MLRRERKARGLRVTDILKLSEETQVLGGRHGDREVVIKRHLGPEASVRAGAQADELAIQHPRMGEGPYRVPEPLLAFPEHGVVVMERAAGQRYDHALRNRPETRAELLRRAGAWLATYTELRRVEDTFGGGFWIKTRRSAMETLSEGPDRDRLAMLIDRMEHERARLGPCPLTRVRSHGDFSVLNLMVDGETVWGVDLQNRSWIALAKDIARFLVHLEILMPHGDTDGPCGLAAEDCEALLSAPGLIRRSEAEGMLPFFVAVELSGRLVSEARFPRVLENARALADRMADTRSDQAAVL